MKRLSQDEVESLMLYKYIRGSHCHGINTPTSDIDYGGVFIMPKDNIYGLSCNMVNDWHDETNDTTYYEIGKYMSLLINANPTILESLFVDDCFVEKTTDAFEIIKAQRDKFVTKECFGSFFGYAKSQIHKARGLNKKIVKPVYKRKSPLDFCYTLTSDGMGSIPFTKYLEIHNLSQEHCGLVNIPNMYGIYSVYYDKDGSLGYCGIVGDNSNELRLHSIPKGETPICHLSYNKDGYTKHCIDYREYKIWERDRNPQRYESNLNKNYDAKNMCECFRLLNMGIEIAEGKGVIVNRKGIDGDLLLDIKAHKFEYDELMEMVDSALVRMEKAQMQSTLPEKIDIDVVNNLLIDVRNAIFR